MKPYSLRWFIWTLLLPFRLYVKYSPTHHLKGFITRRFLQPILPKNEFFKKTLPFGGTIEFDYQETLGIKTLIYGSFEEPEMNYIRSFVNQGTTIMDVGANIGLFTIQLGYAVGRTGKVIAIEPVPGNISRLKQNIEINSLSNIAIFPLAAGEHNGDIKIHLTHDLAFASVLTPLTKATTSTITVPLKTLDTIWEESGSEEVTVIKIDVEGSELSVIKGAQKLLKKDKPILLIEAATQKQADEINQYLSSFGYKQEQPPGFSAWNYIFQQAG